MKQEITAIFELHIRGRGTQLSADHLNSFQSALDDVMRVLPFLPAFDDMRATTADQIRMLQAADEAKQYVEIAKKIVAPEFSAEDPAVFVQFKQLLKDASTSAPLAEDESTVLEKAAEALIKLTVDKLNQI